MRLSWCLLAVGLLGCGPSDQAQTLDAIRQVDPWSAEPTVAARCPRAGNIVCVAVSLASVQSTCVAKADAWLTAYRMPGVRVYVFPDHGQGFASYRNRDLALVRLTWRDDKPQDLSHEVPRLYWGLDDAPPLWIGPVDLPVGDGARRSLALSLGG